MGRKKVPASERKVTIVVSFRIGEELHRQLEKYAGEHTDDAGNPMNVAGAARQLMRRGMEVVGVSAKKGRKRP